MNTQVVDGPNANSAAPVENAVPSMDSIAAKMAAMKENTLRNQMKATEGTETGETSAAAPATPVAPEAVDEDIESTGPEVVSAEEADAEATEEAIAPEEVSTSDSTAEDIIDFLEFAETNPNAKFKFMKNGQEVVIDAKKAASILGQGGAIHEEARQLKIERAEFDEYLTNKRAETEGLLLAMEFTVQPQLQRAYDEIVKTQGYQATFQQQLAATRDPAQVARIQASIQQNERYIQQQAGVIQELKPRVDQFYEIRRGQVKQVLEGNRRGFQDRELKNEYVYNEIRDKVAKNWAGAHRQLVPGVDNIDLISSDEHILSLLRDGLKYREKPTVKQSGGSIAALTSKKPGSAGSTGRAGDDISQLREKAKTGDRKAADNLLVAQLNKLRANRR